MKRKVNLVGQNTLTISLPSGWVDKNDIKKGDELDIFEDGMSLMIGSQKKTKYSKIEMDVSNFNNMIIRTVAAIYKAGYDEVKLFYTDRSELELIQTAVERACHTYEIINFEDNIVHIKTISSLDSRDFELIFKRLLFSAINMGDETLNAIKNNDYEVMQKIILMDKNIDKHSDFCRRLMNKDLVLDFKRPMPMYVLIEQTEIMCDYYKKLCKLIANEKIIISLSDIANLKQITQFVKYFFNNLLKVKISGLSKNIDFVSNLGKMEIDLKLNLKKSFSDLNNIESKFFINHIFEVVFEMKSALMTSFV